MFVTQQQLQDRIMFAVWRAGKAERKFPIGLHSMPKRKSRRFAGVGFVNPNGSDDPKPFFDLYVGINGELYDVVNEMVRKACAELNQTFIDMR